MLFQITSRSGVPDIFKRRNIASLWFVPICWCLISDNFRLSQIIACTFSAELRSIKLLFTLSKGSSRHSPESSAGWARFSNYFPTRCLPCLFSFIFSFRSQWHFLLTFLMFAILEEPLPWGISQPKADFRRSGEVRRIFACQPNDVGSDRKVGGESLRRSEYFITFKWVAIGIRA